MNDSKRLKKALKNGYTFDISSKFVDWVDAYNSINSCMKGTGSKLFKSLHPIGVELLVARDGDGNIVARAQVRGNSIGKAYGVDWALAHKYAKEKGYAIVNGVWKDTEIATGVKLVATQERELIEIIGSSSIESIPTSSLIEGVDYTNYRISDSYSVVKLTTAGKQFILNTFNIAEKDVIKFSPYDTDCYISYRKYKTVKSVKTSVFTHQVKPCINARLYSDKSATFVADKEVAVSYRDYKIAVNIKNKTARNLDYSDYDHMVGGRQAFWR